MSRESSKQRAIVGRVMHEYQQGTLASGSGKPVRSARQAVAIALHEAGASNRETPARNRRSLARTEAREGKAALLAEAKARNIPGRSRMGVAELRRALDK